MLCLETNLVNRSFLSEHIHIIGFHSPSIPNGFLVLGDGQGFSNSVVKKNHQQHIIQIMLHHGSHDLVKAASCGSRSAIISRNQGRATSVPYHQEKSSVDWFSTCKWRREQSADVNSKISHEL